MTEVAEMCEVTLEDISVKHRKERKELQAKIQALKKNAPKSDKKKRKEANDEVLRMENEMEQRHSEELKLIAINGKHTTEETDAFNSSPSHQNFEETQRVSKAQKRRDKKAREAREREEEFKAAAEDSHNAPKTIEARKIEAKLKERLLSNYLISSDGDCLFNAIRHQLLYHGIGSFTVQQLREKTANYIRANKETLIFYMTDPKTGNLLNDDEFTKYCEDVRSTPTWGSEIEIKALSSVLKVPIEVLQADGPPTSHGSDEFVSPSLVITYHRHMFSLGEHYNSTISYEPNINN